MARRRLGPGEIGGISLTRVGNRVQARARTRDAAGNMLRVSYTADSDEAAVAGVTAEVHRAAFGSTEITRATTLAELLDLWLTDRRDAVRPQTIRVYQAAADRLNRRAGALTLEQLTPGRCKRLLSDEAINVSGHSAKQDRVALRGALDMALESDAISRHPVSAIPRRVRASSETRAPLALNVDQVQELRRAVIRREERVKLQLADARPYLRWAVEVQLGSGLRIGEVLALRHRDVDLTNGVITVTGTLVDGEQWEVVRQDVLKGKGQARRIRLPRFAVLALTEARASCTDVPSRLPDAPAIQSQAGTAVAARNLRRQLRELRQDRELLLSLAATGLKAEDLIPHLLRRTAATLVAMVDEDLSGAQRLLGHSDQRTTRDSYAGAAFRVVGSAEVLDSLLGSGQGPSPGNTGAVG